jgi:hypothetical protein
MMMTKVKDIHFSCVSPLLPIVFSRLYRRRPPRRPQCRRYAFSFQSVLMKTMCQWKVERDAKAQSF